MYSWDMFGDIISHPSSSSSATAKTEVTCVCTSGTVPKEKGSKGHVHVDNQLSLLFEGGYSWRKKI